MELRGWRLLTPWSAGRGGKHAQSCTSCGTLMTTFRSQGVPSGQLHPGRKSLAWVSCHVLHAQSIPQQLPRGACNGGAYSFFLVFEHAFVLLEYALNEFRSSMRKSLKGSTCGQRVLPSFMPCTCLIAFSVPQMRLMFEHSLIGAVAVVCNAYRRFASLSSAVMAETPGEVTI